MTDGGWNKRKVYSVTAQRRGKMLYEMFDGERQGNEVRTERRHRFYIEMLFGVGLFAGTTR